MKLPAEKRGQAPRRLGASPLFSACPRPSASPGNLSTAEVQPRVLRRSANGLELEVVGILPRDGADHRRLVRRRQGECLLVEGRLAAERARLPALDDLPG